ncbi:MAG: hypothetical protein QOH28_1549 [Actinomycetota bacterium]|nr:hypothetical protein [Actinomycetota bacterium]
MQAAPTSSPPESRARELLADAFAGTPGRMRLLGALAVAACVAFGGLAFLLGTNLDRALGASRAHAAQLVRIQTIRTSLVKADANATNAFLVGGLEPTDVRTGYADGIQTAAATLADASSADANDAHALQAVNEALASYAGMVEAARANNRQGFPIGAAYLRAASRLIQSDALPPLEQLVNEERSRVDSSSNAATDAQRELVALLVLVVASLVVTQVWLFAKTRRVLNPPLVAATAMVVVAGLAGLGVVAWSRGKASDARRGPYTETVALATARIDGFDAKSAESLTLIAHGSGQAYEDRFKSVSLGATRALTPAGVGQFGKPEADAREALAVYVNAHTRVRAADDRGDYDGAVRSATGTGEANRAFGGFETTSRQALALRSAQASDDLAHARSPLLAISWLMLVIGLVAAFAARRGVAQRLREYR